MPEEVDWAAVLQRVVEGDRVALAQLARLVNRFLLRWHAYAFRDEWEDLIQEVVSAAALALRDGRIRERRAVVAFLMSTARFKYLDRLRGRLGRHRGETLAWEDAVARLDACAEPGPAAEIREDVQRALAQLPEKKRAALVAVYVDGCTYEEAAQATGIPLGTLKRYLRDGLAQLRADLAGALEG